jgi:hypothetical protein
MEKATATETAKATKSAINGSVVEASFTLKKAQTVGWAATNNSSSAGAFFLTTNPAANQNEIFLTDDIKAGKSKSGTSELLKPDTYHISINLASMKPGSYTITFDPN